MSVSVRVSVRVKVWTKERNKLPPESAALLLRVGLNLRFLHEAKSALTLTASKK